MQFTGSSTMAVELASLREQLADATRNSICDVCTGKNITDTPCICGDTGLARDAVIGFQKELIQARRERDQAQEQLAELAECRRRFGWLLERQSRVLGWTVPLIDAELKRDAALLAREGER